tara:strand:+ start:1952 stop:2218 length:267 start_codon:yes stop_codon:yes gene_type:complete
MINYNYKEGDKRKIILRSQVYFDFLTENNYSKDNIFPYMTEAKYILVPGDIIIILKVEKYRTTAVDKRGLIFFIYNHEVDKFSKKIEY